MATWPAIDGGRPAEAPVLLLPVALSKREGSNSYHLAATGGFQINLVLLHVLQEQFRVALQPDELLARFAGDTDQDKVFDVTVARSLVNRRRPVLPTPLSKSFDVSLGRNLEPKPALKRR